MADKFPLVVYKDGKRIVIGEVELFGSEIGAVVSDVTSDMAANLAHLRADEDINTKRRRNVFEQDKD